MGRLPSPIAISAVGRTRQGRVSDGTGRLDHDPPLPDRPRLEAEPVRHRGGRLLLNTLSSADAFPLHAQPADHALLRPVHPRQAGAPRPSRSRGPAWSRPTGRAATARSSPSSRRKASTPTNSRRRCAPRSSRRRRDATRRRFRRSAGSAPWPKIAAPVAVGRGIIEQAAQRLRRIGNAVLLGGAQQHLETVGIDLEGDLELLAAHREGPRRCSQPVRYDDRVSAEHQAITDADLTAALIRLGALPAGAQPRITRAHRRCLVRHPAGRACRPAALRESAPLPRLKVAPALGSADRAQPLRMGPGFETVAEICPTAVPALIAHDIDHGLFRDGLSAAGRFSAVEAAAARRHRRAGGRGPPSASGSHASMPRPPIAPTSPRASRPTRASTPSGSSPIWSPRAASIATLADRLDALVRITASTRRATGPWRC